MTMVILCPEQNIHYDRNCLMIIDWLPNTKITGWGTMVALKCVSPGVREDYPYQIH